MGADTGFDDGRADRLGDVIHSPHFETNPLVFDAGHRRHENDRDTAAIRVGFQAAADFQPTEPRHHDIEQDQIGRFVRIDDFQRFFPGGGCPDAVVILEDVDNQADVVWIVINDQDVLFGEQGHHDISRG